MSTGEALNEVQFKPMSHAVGLQVSYGLDTEMQPQDSVWKIRTYLGEVFHKLARQRDSDIVERHLCKDHVHIYIAIPPNYSVPQIIGFMKGKSAIHIAREVEGRARGYAGQSF